MTRNACRRLALTLATVMAGALTTTAVASPGSGGISPEGEPATESAQAASQEGTFPIRGPHTYGDGLGAGRGHQGQDLMAKCGKPVVAATSGRVRVRDYQGSGAGNYVVIKGKDRRYDYVYMHMLEAANVREGQRVSAGEIIGRVGSTGRSSACHLHFEMWTAPGWYRGGGVVNPTPFLKAWDKKKG